MYPYVLTNKYVERNQECVICLCFQVKFFELLQGTSDMRYLQTECMNHKLVGSCPDQNWVPLIIFRLRMMTTLHLFQYYYTHKSNEWSIKTFRYLRTWQLTILTLRPMSDLCHDLFVIWFDWSILEVMIMFYYTCHSLQYLDARSIREKCSRSYCCQLLGMQQWPRDEFHVRGVTWIASMLVRLIFHCL